MARQQGLMGRKVRFSVTVSTQIGDTTIRDYKSQTGTCVSGSWGRGYWSKQFVNVLAEDGRVYELPLHAITVIKDDPCQVAIPKNDLAAIRKTMADRQPPQVPQQGEEGWDKL